MTPEIETHTKLHRTGHHWLDISLALSAIFISVTSLAVAIHHGRTMERMAEENARLVAASSWPYIQFIRSNALLPSNLIGPARPTQGESFTSWSIVNAGVGPAKIESAELFWEGRPVHSMRELVEACCGLHESSSDDGMTTSNLQGIVLRAGDTLPLLLMKRTPENESVWSRVNDLEMSRVKFRICYCSVFDECWITDLRTLHPEHVQQCPVTKEPFT